MTVEIDLYSLIKFIGGLLAVIAFIFLIYRAYKGIATFFKSREYDLDKQGIKKRWQEIEKMLDQPGEMNYKLAVMEADKLLDYVLKSMSMSGKDMGERIRFASFRFNRLKKVWWAHVLRNQLVHEATFSLNHSTAKRAIKTFERALRELGAL
ncbi:hypothetical protein KKD80_00775 [Patescibacteria group bacterium]|nr:hypothetical protein [Patescibacteria group bacterium]